MWHMHTWHMPPTWQHTRRSAYIHDRIVTIRPKLYHGTAMHCTLCCKACRMHAATQPRNISSRSCSPRDLRAASFQQTLANHREAAAWEVQTPHAWNTVAPPSATPSVQQTVTNRAPSQDFNGASSSGPHHSRYHTHHPSTAVLPADSKRSTITSHVCHAPHAWQQHPASSTPASMREQGATPFVPNWVATSDSHYPGSAQVQHAHRRVWRRRQCMHAASHSQQRL